MPSVIRPKRYPHWGFYAYTRRGFDVRVRPRLIAEGFSAHDVARLRELYFGGIRYERHCDETGFYRNKRRYRLYRLSRDVMKYDRKNPTFSLVIRSGLFYVCLDETGRVEGFQSPFNLRCAGRLFI